MSDANVKNIANGPSGEVPPEPEDEGFRDEQIKAETERKARAAEALDERSAEAKKRYRGVDDIGDTPGSALSGATRKDAPKT